jgi:hypothetical protein
MDGCAAANSAKAVISANPDCLLQLMNGMHRKVF